MRQEWPLIQTVRLLLRNVKLTHFASGGVYQSQTDDSTHRYNLRSNSVEEV